ncbi:MULTISPECIES: DNA polymerase/3'-5' exonuclease PolX [Bacillaceae]|uniref:DNA polymerase/3'-5' exonuclease PolX n=1 Tax=Bacillaceae TaxID=186817 RepID=UPI001E471DDF|nr:MULTISPECIES: DNA polymerase/3'-5' exonuclease PolX [Bacillaceae]MCE4051227.1 DNA polymerase/3'-5' exonuclease PolX [Bacillus sp. Au-Bac7]MCM3029904.1 DNA polymerase/3'-5' exonuclease PolX [Niallia sp. MER 6]
MTTKKEVVRQLEQIAIYMELKGENSFKISAFRKAAQALETTEQTLDEIEDFTAFPGIGKGTAAVIEDFIHTGESSVLKELKEEVPKGLIPLLQLPGLGGKKIAKLYKELGIENAEDLKLACQEKKVQSLSGFGKKTEDKILEALDSFGSRPDRLPLAYMLRVAFSIEGELEKIEAIERFSRAGSIRRMRETIKDLDFIIATNSPADVKDKLLTLPGIKEVIGAGNTKVSVVLELEFDVSIDFRLVKPEEFATTLHHFTGSKDHNVRMRQLAKERGKKISEYGVEDTETGEVETFSTEEEFYHYFGLPFIPPEMREDGKEVEDFKEELDIISLEDIKGDLHMHTTWSDGAFSIEEMIEANRQRGYKYMAITDHSRYLKVANGLTPERLQEQLQIIKALNEKYDDITILAGVEMDILPDGTLDYDDELLEQMDIVIASIHSSFSQPKHKIMERLENALRNKHVDIIAHPTGRKIGIRDGYEVDMDDLIRLAKETNTVLELNSNPNRLDLNAENIKKAQDAGVHLVINTDAHHTKELAYMGIGVSTAKKGWINKNTVINTWDTEKLLDFLKNRHK